MGNLCWVRAAFLALALQLVYSARVSGVGESGDDWESVVTLGQADGSSFKAIVQPFVQMAANSYRYPKVVAVPGWTLIDAVAPIHGGMHATLFKENGNSKRLVLSFRGTDMSGSEGSITDTCANEILWSKSWGPISVNNCSGFSSETLDYYKQAVDYTENVIRMHPDSALLLTGHSLGAGLALLVTATLDVSPSLPVVAFRWDEVMRTSWESQVGTTCLYPTQLINVCTECFNETGGNSTLQMQHPPSRLQKSISTEELESDLKIADACWSCFLKTHILKHLIDLVNLGVKPICEFRSPSTVLSDPDNQAIVSSEFKCT